MHRSCTLRSSLKIKRKRKKGKRTSGHLHFYITVATVILARQFLINKFHFELHMETLSHAVFCGHQQVEMVLEEKRQKKLPFMSKTKPNSVVMTAALLFKQLPALALPCPS